jgi:hypothetical protein
MLKSCQLWMNVLADLFRFLVLSLRSESSLAAENLFLRKQLAFYRERNIRPCVWRIADFGRTGRWSADLPTFERRLEFGFE